MKKIIAFILFIAACQFSFAKCTSAGISLLSGNRVLNRNGQIIMEFYAASQLLVPDLGKKYPVYLKGNKLKYQLVPVEILKGEFNITQVVFRANSLLDPKEKYTLFIDGLPSSERSPKEMTRWGYSPVVFTVKENIDTGMPQLLAAPKYAKSTMVEFGCGPSRWVYFSLSAKDDTELFVKARVKNTATGLLTDQFLLIENGMVKIGHGMCGGSFRLEGTGLFMVSFSICDQSGNSTEIPGSLMFTPPTKTTEAE